jgi:hypothetical protein
MYRSWLVAVIVVLAWLPAGAKSIAASGKIQFEIVSVDRRPDPPKGLATGVLMLAFKNLNSNPTDLVFMFPRCKESFNVSPVRSRATSADPSETHTDFALVKYLWKLGGKVVNSGIVDIAQSTITLNHVGVLYVPIRIPERPGRYTLSVDFDNSRLHEVRRLSSLGPQYGIFFRAHDERFVNILSR